MASRASLIAGDPEHVDRTLVWLDRDMNLIPVSSRSWDVGDDAKTFTFHLRKGSQILRWRGNDQRGLQKWYYEHYAAHPDLSRACGQELTTVGEDGKKVLCEAGFPDDYTVVYRICASESF